MICFFGLDSAVCDEGNPWQRLQGNGLDRRKRIRDIEMERENQATKEAGKN